MVQRAAPPIRLIPRRDLLTRLGLRSANTVRDHIRRGLLTHPIRISDGRTTPVAWPEPEINAIVAARIRGLGDNEVRTLVLKLEADRKAAR